MADLTDKTPAATFKSMLNVGTADNQELNATLRIIEDGKGNDSDLKLATNKVRVNTALGVAIDPAYPLDVTSTNVISAQFHNNQDTNSITIRDQDTTSDAHVGIGAQDNDFFIRAGNAEKLRINSDGEVGIGTNNPQSLLHIVGTGSNTSGIVFENAHDDFRMYFNNNSDNSDFVITYTATGGAELTFNYDGTLCLNESNGDKVGIGDSAPNQLLGIKGDNAQISIEESNTEFLRLGVGETEGDHIIGFDDGGKLKIGCYDSPTDATIAAKVTILSNGNVGIGDTSPAAPLTVNTDAVGSAIKVVSTDSDAAAAPNIMLHRHSSSPADDDILGKLLFNGRNDNSQDVVYSAIYGQISDASDGAEDGSIYAFVKVNGADKGAFKCLPSATVFNYSSADMDFRILGDNDSNLFWADSGVDCVSIGNTADANFKFKVYDSTTGYVSLINNNSTDDASHGLNIKAGKVADDDSNPIMIEDQGGNDLFKITALGSASLGGGANSSNYLLNLKAKTGVTSRILIDGSGNTVDSNISFQNRYGNRFSWVKGADEGTGNSGLSFGTGVGGTPAERMRIDENGKVGIGITAPTTTLDVEGTVSYKNATLSTAGPVDDYDVSGVTIIHTDTSSNNVTIGGFAGGVQGQIIYIFKGTTGNETILEHNETGGTQKIYLTSGADESIVGYGGWMLVCSGSHWFSMSNPTGAADAG